LRRSNINRLLQKKIAILDGATGTELYKRGMPPEASLELWSLENPAVLADIHSSYLAVGADIIYTCTFGANRFKLGEYGAENVLEINRELAALAKRAVGKRALIAGDMGPTGRFIEPFGDLSFEEAVGVYKEQASGLIQGGVDLIVIETMIDIQEARAALIAVKELSRIFTMVTMTFEKDGRTLNGTDPVAALITLQSLGADAVGCNCSMGPDGMLDLVSAMKPYAKVPLVAKPNAGLPRLVDKKAVFDMDAATFASFGPRFAASGVNLMGGCCGTSPDHISALRRNLEGSVPIPPRVKSLSAVSSPRHYVVLDESKPLYVIGERLNPTGKKALQQELLEGKTAIVRQMAKEQEKKGADLLDVNVGVPGLDEIKAIRNVLHVLMTTASAPLVIDSAKIETIEAALRIYAGRALINSISGEKEKLAKLLPIAAKYGAMFVLLPLTEGEIPETAAKRIKVIRMIYREPHRLGFVKDDIVVDGLTMTVASNPQAARETLDVVAWCRKTFKVRTVLGLSNVSFGMPERKWMNAAFLAMAQSAGLTMAIANPESDEFMNIKRAGDVLRLRDKDAAAYITNFKKPSLPPADIENRSPEQKVHTAVLEGNREEITDFIKAAMNGGIEPSRLVDAFMVPAIVRVGEFYEKKEYFLPQLIASAEAMKKGISYLDPFLQKENAQAADKGVIMLATVKGDIHDIGKNIVALILRNHGYRVIDLGKDVPNEDIIHAAGKLHPDIIGLSALMTTTMINMKDIVALAGEKLPGCRFIVGGAVVTRSFADAIGAAYAKDGVEAVRVVEELLRIKKN
jgi:5-methyltetrahydrofolate--homocysteine methyltransferase